MLSKLNQLVNRPSTARTNVAAFVHQRGLSALPASVDFTDDVRMWNTYVSEEGFIEVLNAGDLGNGADINARTLHVQDEVGDTSMFWKINIGTSEQNRVIGKLTKAGPNFLTVDDPVVAVAHGASAE